MRIGESDGPLQIITSPEPESIEVLKDAGATAIYGARDGNEAILIPTKNGKSGRLRLILNLHCQKVKTIIKMYLVNTRQYFEMR